MKILFHGYFGFGNTGDEVVLAALMSEYRSKYNDAEFVVLSSNPRRTAKLHGVRAIRESLTSLTFWREFLSTDVLVFAGGGRYGGPTWRRMAILGMLAKLLGKRVVFRSVGVYPYDWRGTPVINDRPKAFKGLTGLLIKLLVDFSDYVSVRDAYSYAVLRLTGVNKTIHIEQDPALRLRPPEHEKCREVINKWLDVKRPILGINLRTLDPQTNEVVLGFAAGVANWFLRSYGGSVVFIPFGFGSFSNRFFDNDLIIGGELKRRVRDVVFITEELSPGEIMCLLQGVDAVIAMRHHAVVFGIALNKPVVALVYDTKTLELLRQLNIGAGVLPISITDLDGAYLIHATEFLSKFLHE